MRSFHTSNADDPDSAGGGNFNPAGSATPMTGSAVPDTAGGTFGTTGTASTVPTSHKGFCFVSHQGLEFHQLAVYSDSSSPQIEEDAPIGTGVEIVTNSLIDEIVELHGEFGLDLWRDVNLLCQSLHSDDVEEFWRTQDEWVVSSWKLYPRSSVHVLDLTNGKTVYMFVDKWLALHDNVFSSHGYSQERAVSPLKRFVVPADSTSKVPADYVSAGHVSFQLTEIELLDMLL
ncbi:hypothetical protein Tco_0530953 [Tanacetum coccineum]